jgi:hypothetical protein
MLLIAFLHHEVNLNLVFASDYEPEITAAQESLSSRPGATASYSSKWKKQRIFFSTMETETLVRTEVLEVGALFYRHNLISLVVGVNLLAR